MTYPTAEEILARYRYEPETGHFLYREGARAGTVAGAPQKNGTVRIRVGEHKCRALTLAWILTKGPVPKHCRVAPINDLPFDARPDNLELVYLPKHERRRKRVRHPAAGKVKFSVTLDPVMFEWLRSQGAPMTRTVAHLIQKAMLDSKA